MSRFVYSTHAVTTPGVLPSGLGELYASDKHTPGISTAVYHLNTCRSNVASQMLIIKNKHDTVAWLRVAHGRNTICLYALMIMCDSNVSHLAALFDLLSSLCTSYNRGKRITDCGGLSYLCNTADDYTQTF